MLASGEYTDAFAAKDTSSFYTGGLDKAIEEEIIVPLEDYGEYYKNYNYWRSVDDMTLYSSVTPENHIGGIYMLKVPRQDAFQGPVIRMDLLKEYGFEGEASNIVTLDDFAEVLAMFQNHGVSIPWWGSGNFMLGLDTFIMPAFDIYNEGLLYQLDGKVMFGPAQDSFRDYLALYRDWYQNGYIGADFMSQNTGINDDLIGGMMCGDVGIGVTPNALFDMINEGTANDGKWTGISIPVAKEDQVIQASFDGTWGPSRKAYTNTVLSISTACPQEMIPIILQYFDYLYAGYRTAVFHGSAASVYEESLGGRKTNSGVCGGFAAAWNDLPKDYEAQPRICGGDWKEPGVRQLLPWAGKQSNRKPGRPGRDNLRSAV